MINHNGNYLLNEFTLSNNRAFLYGDAVFETLKIVNNQVLFLEDHYFRLMASMRIIRMEIPSFFTMEFFENSILETVQKNNISESARVRITVYRNEGGLYTPLTNTVSYIITASGLHYKAFQLLNTDYEVDLFKEYFITKHLLSTLKTTNKLINIIGSVFAQENNLQNCILLNDAKNVVEVLNGNIFMLWQGQLTTPPLTEGCLNGIMRKQILKIAKTIDNITVVEAPISPFDLQKADELFITNSITGIQPVTKYRKKDFNTNFSAQLVVNLNKLIDL